MGYIAAHQHWGSLSEVEVATGKATNGVCCGAPPLAEKARVIGLETAGRGEVTPGKQKCVGYEMAVVHACPGFFCIYPACWPDRVPPTVLLASAPKCVDLHFL